MTGCFNETEVVARVDGLTLARLRSYAAARCVRPELREGRLTFTESDIARLRLLCELATDFDLDEDASALVLSLVDQIYSLRQELRLIAEAVAREPEDVRGRISEQLAANRQWRAQPR